MTWFDSFYFTVVSVTTVGYGDITASSDAAKAVTILVIFFGFALIPAQIAQLVSTVVNHPLYLGSLSLPTRCQHILVAGVVDYELLVCVLNEVID